MLYEVLKQITIINTRNEVSAFPHKLKRRLLKLRSYNDLGKQYSRNLHLAGGIINRANAISGRNSSTPGS